MKKHTFLAMIALLMSFLLITSCGSDTDPDGSSSSDASKSDGQWWVFAPDYVPNGLPMFEVIRWNGTDDTAAGYTHTGEETFEAAVSVEGNEVTFDIDLTAVTYILKDGTLFDPDTGEAVFVRSQDPQFNKAALNLDGKWYRDGNKDSADYLEIKGDTYTLTDGEYGRKKTGKWEPGPDTVRLQDGTELKTPPQFKAEFPGPTGYPAAGNKVLFLEEHFSYAGYVHESALENNPEVNTALMSLCALNSSWESVYDEGRALLTFHPNYFQIQYYAIDGEGLENPDPSRPTDAGTWSYSPTDSLSLSFTNGDKEDFGFGVSTKELEIESLGLVFERR